MKKIIVILVLLVTINFVFADFDNEATKVDVYVDDMLMDTYDEEQDVVLPAFIYNSRTMLPLKKVFSLFGIGSDQIVWHADDKSITVITNDLDEIWMQIDNHDIHLNGEIIYSDVAPKVFNNRTFVPLAIISKLLGEQPVWHDASRSVTMTPSMYTLNTGQLQLDRQLGYSNPVYLMDFDHYLIQKYNVSTRKVEKSFTLKLSAKPFEVLFSEVLNENYLSTEDFKVLDNNIYYRLNGRDGLYAISEIGNKTVEIHASQLSIEEIKTIVENMREVN